MGTLADLLASEEITKELDKTFDNGYNQALDDFRKLANEHMVDSEAIGDFVLTDGSIDYIIDTLKR